MAKRKSVDSQAYQTMLPMRPPLRILILFSIGQFGWSLASFAVGNLLVYFYMPPEQGPAMFPSFLFQGPVFGVLTLVGLLSAGGRILDGLVDPLVANWSDRKQSKSGKRRWFMLRGALPFALFGALVFFPLSTLEPLMTFIWLAVVISLYYFFFAVYVIPYNAMMAELGHTAQERLKISMLVSIAWALGFVAGNSTYALQGKLESLGKTPLEAFQTAIIWLQVLALICMLIPAVFIREQRYTRQAIGEYSVRESVQKVFGNRNFRWFMLSFLLYWLALTFIQQGIAYYTTLLFGLDKHMAFSFSMISFVSSFLFYFPVNALAGKIGHKNLMLLAYLVLGVIFLITALAKDLPVSKEYLLYALAVAAAAPLAIFGIMPNVIVGNEAALEEQKSGQQLTGMYFGMTAFTMKIGISAANLIFPSLLLLGRSMENPAGVQATAIAASIFCFAGCWTFRNYVDLLIR